jgi:hypothetical protein
VELEMVGKKERKNNKGTAKKNIGKKLGKWWKKKEMELEK